MARMTAVAIITTIAILMYGMASTVIAWTLTIEPLGLMFSVITGLLFLMVTLLLSDYAWEYSKTLEA